MISERPGNGNARAEELKRLYGVDRITVANIFTSATVAGIDFYGLIDKDLLREERDEVSQRMRSVNIRILRDDSVFDLFSKAEFITDYTAYVEQRTKLTNRLLGLLFEDLTIEEKAERNRTNLAATAIDVAGEYMSHRLVASAERLIQQSGSPVLADLSVTAICFLNAKIEGLSIADIIDKDSSPHQVLRFLVESQMIGNGKDPRAQVKQNLQDPVWSKYPMSAINKVIDGASVINSLYMTSEGMVDEFHMPPYQFAEDIKRTAIRIINSFQVKVDSIGKVVLNPKSPDFAKLKETLDSYTGTEKSIALHILFDGSSEYIKDFYRTAVRLSQNGQNSEFYTELVRSMKDYLEDSAFVDLLTANDMSTFFNAPSTEGSVVSIKDLEKKSLSIANTTRDRYFTVDPDLIQSNEVVKPAEISLKLDQYNPRKFVVLLDYENEEGESQTLYVEVDSRRYEEGVEWSFVESPSQMPGIKDILQNTTDKILDAVLSKAKSGKQIKAITPTPSTARRLKDTRILPLTEVQITPKRGRKTEEPIKEEGEKRRKVKNSIVVLDQEEFDRQVKELAEKRQLSAQDVRNISEAIREFNQRGVSGKFQKLGDWVKGKDLYALRVNSLSKKPIRILLREIHPEDDEERKLGRRFAVVRVGFKEDAFRGIAKAKSNPYH